MPLEKRSDAIEDFILDMVELYPNEVTKRTTDVFGISRQAIARYLRSLVKDGVIRAHGKTRGRSYELVKLIDKSFVLEDVAHLQEDIVWRENIASSTEGLSLDVVDICRYGFTEMVNNVIDHSESSVLEVSVERDARRVTLRVNDRGVGIFSKIQKALGLADPREAVLELSKGKFTTDQKRHTGEGIFFTSQAFDSFTILSGRLIYLRTNEKDDWLFELQELEKDDEGATPGTTVLMSIRYDSKRTLRTVFNKFSDPASYAFTRTHVPLTLARYEGDELVSRSQARRILQRFEKFEEVMLDFKRIASIGQAFADEIFRVFHNEHPEVAIITLNTTPEIDQMVSRAKMGLLNQLALPGL